MFYLYCWECYAAHDHEHCPDPRCICAYHKHVLEGNGIPYTPEPTPTPGAPLAAPTVTLCGNGVPVVTVDRAQFEDTARAVRQQPATCQRCYFVAPQHAPGCVNIDKPRCPDCGHYWCSGCANLWPNPEPTPSLPAYNPEDGAPCAQCGHGQELHANGTEDCWWSTDATPATFCPCPRFLSREAAQRADEAELPCPDCGKLDGAHTYNCATSWGWEGTPEGTPEGDAARWLANRGLPPMAGGSGNSVVFTAAEDYIETLEHRIQSLEHAIGALGFAPCEVCGEWFQTTNERAGLVLRYGTERDGGTQVLCTKHLQERAHHETEPETIDQLAYWYLGQDGARYAPDHIRARMRQLAP